MLYDHENAIKRRLNAGGVDALISDEEIHYEYSMLSQWCERLFNANSPYYITFDGENKFLERQLLDMLYGLSFFEYIYQKDKNLLCECDLSKIHILGKLGNSSAITKILDKIIDLCSISENFKELISPIIDDIYRDEVYSFYRCIMDIFRELTFEFVEYIYLLGTHEKRKKYMDRCDIVEPIQGKYGKGYRILNESNKDLIECIMQNIYSYIDEEDGEFSDLFSFIDSQKTEYSQFTDISDDPDEL